MKNYLVIGNPIEHSLSPKLHNYWIKENNIEAKYEKLKLNENEIKNLILEVREQKLNGVNVTVPFKKKVINYLDDLSLEAEKTQSVNTIYFKDNKVVGHNTDIEGFELAIRNLKFNMMDKKIFILGAGGVVPSIVFALNRMKVSEITISNRTKTKAEQLNNLFKNLKIVNWGDIPEFDVIINATSIGLNKNDEINLDFTKIGKNKLFYDVIYNPKETNFLKQGKELDNQIENGKMMFIYQAQAAFKLWHGVLPEINEKVIKLLD
jgi:shikimate dehydrogenase